MLKVFLFVFSLFFLNASDDGDPIDVLNYFPDRALRDGNEEKNEECLLFFLEELDETLFGRLASQQLLALFTHINTMKSQEFCTERFVHYLESATCSALCNEENCTRGCDKHCAGCQRALMAGVKKNRHKRRMAVSSKRGDKTSASSQARIRAKNTAAQSKKNS